MRGQSQPPRRRAAATPCLAPALMVALGIVTFSGSRALCADKIDPRLARLVRADVTRSPLLVWVEFADKGATAAQKAALSPALVSPRCLRRRAAVWPADRIVDETDLPLEPAYVEAVTQRVLAVRQRSKWLDAVSVVATPEQIQALEMLPVVRRIDLVARFGKQPAQRREAAPAPALQSADIDYGLSLAQLQQIGVPALHARGIDGRGVLVGHFDAGYLSLQHEALAALQVVARRDFVGHDLDPTPAPGEPLFGWHGTATLSVLGGHRPGQLVGPAYGAQFLLARTEDEFSETPLEEDNWIAAIEWADSLGVDVVSSSVGYNVYSPPYPSWTWEDMDGNTTRITRAADLAVARGIVVVNAAGNEGPNPVHNTLVAPADGDSVLTVGGVTEGGTRVESSSMGPTTSTPPRIKPDVAALGANVWVASAGASDTYTYLSGTSGACPLVAGTVALLLSARPGSTPMQIVEALHATASQASTPDNSIGWGIVNAPAALDRMPLPVFQLTAGVPNPFRAGSSIRYVLPGTMRVTMRVYDVRGRLVRTLLHAAVQPAGDAEVLWNGEDDARRAVASGVYLCRLRAEGTIDAAPRDLAATRKLVVIR